MINLVRPLKKVSTTCTVQEPIPGVLHNLEDVYSLFLHPSEGWEDLLKKNSTLFSLKPIKYELYLRSKKMNNLVDFPTSKGECIGTLEIN